VRHEHGAVGELEERRQRGAERRGVGDHRVGDPGQERDERRDRDAGLHERLELAEHLAAAHLDRADLGDAGVDRCAAGGLEVDDDERDVDQLHRVLPGERAGLRQAPQLLLDDPRRPGLRVGLHDADVMGRHRQFPPPGPGRVPPASGLPGGTQGR
jgi:hypothetical protein